MRMSVRERAACEIHASDRRAQAQVRRRLHSLAQGNPEKVKAFLAERPLSEVRNNPAMMRLKQIVGA